ncbi:MAG: hypothetical protein IKG58_01025 [Bacilli bacterium]|nr:hypothetical protein [Bacilli bacterium]MBR3049127.1 hypothetical protein [Bacilli bacterium]
MKDYSNLKFKDLENMPIGNFKLSARTRNSLERVGIENFAQVITLSERDLMKIRNLGQESIKELDEVIESMNNKEIRRNMPKVKAYTIGMSDAEKEEYIKRNIDKVLDMKPRDIGISEEVCKKLERSAVNSVFKLVLCNDIKLSRFLSEEQLKEVSTILSKLNLHTEMTKSEIDDLNSAYVMFKFSENNTNKESILKSLKAEKEVLEEKLKYVDQEIKRLEKQFLKGGTSNGPQK